MQIGRMLKHVTATHWRTRMLFPSATLDAIEQAVKRAEQTHAGEIRFAIETALTPETSTRATRSDHSVGGLVMDATTPEPGW